MKDPIAIVAPAENPANRNTMAELDARWKALDVREAKTLAEIRLERGRVLIEARKQFPTSGPRAGGWGVKLAIWGIAERTAREWMALAGYIEKIPAPGAEISRTVTKPTIPTRREVATVAREIRRVIVDHSQDAAGGGDEPAWQEPTYTPEGEAPAPAAKPCKLCGTVPGSRPTKLASTCKNGCGGLALQPRASGAPLALPTRADASPVPSRQLAFDWTATAEAVRRDCGAAGVEAAADLVDDMCSRVPGLAEALRVRLAAG